MNLPETIPPIPNEIIEAAKSGKLIFFIGAGVSRRAGGPSWKELADRFLGQLAHQSTSHVSFGDVFQLRDESPKKKISIAWSIWKTDGIERPNFRGIIQPNFDSSKVPSVYQYLYAINACYVTTNYDEWLDCLATRGAAPLDSHSSVADPEGPDTSVAGQPSGQMVVYEKADLTREKLLIPGAVIHLHGSVANPDSMILSTRDYFEHYQHPFVRGFLEKLFSGEFTVVFVGYGVEEDEILEFVIRKREVKQERKFFRLYPLYNHQTGIYEHIASYSKGHCDVHLLPFSCEQNGEAQLDIVLRQWSKTLQGSMRPPSIFDKLELLDEALDG